MQSPRSSPRSRAPLSVLPLPLYIIQVTAILGQVFHTQLWTCWAEGVELLSLEMTLSITHCKVPLPCPVALLWEE